MQLHELFIKTNNRRYRVALEDILLVESSNNYCRIHTTAKKSHLVRRPLEELADKLPTEAFIRIHKCYIIGRSHIQFFEGYHVQVNDKRLPIGRAYYNELMGKMVVV